MKKEQTITEITEMKEITEITEITEIKEIEEVEVCAFKREKLNILNISSLSGTLIKVTGEKDRGDIPRPNLISSKVLRADMNGYACSFVERMAGTEEDYSQYKKIRSISIYDKDGDICFVYTLSISERIKKVIGAIVQLAKSLDPSLDSFDVYENSMKKKREESHEVRMERIKEITLEDIYMKREPKETLLEMRPILNFDRPLFDSSFAPMGLQIDKYIQGEYIALYVVDTTTVEVSKKYTPLILKEKEYKKFIFKALGINTSAALKKDVQSMPEVCVMKVLLAMHMANDSHGEV